MDSWSLIASVFVISALLSSFWQITQHLIYFNKPYLQKYIVRILWMVPIYSMNAWVALVLPKLGVYLDVCRETYEAFVIYSFMKYLLNYLHYDLNLQQTIDYKPGVNHLFPFCFFGSTSGGRLFLHRCKHGILQYVVVRPLTTLLAVISQLFGVYGEGEYDLYKTYIYLLFVNNISQIMAMYCLVIFYTGYKIELSGIRPLPKFLCIKLVVFFSFFQSVLISFIIDFMKPDDPIGARLEQGRKIQDFLICIEMLFASFAHHYAYSHRPFVDSPFQDASEPCCFAFLRTLDFSDERNDVLDHLYQTMLKIRRSFTRKVKPLPSVLENGDEMFEYTPLNDLNMNRASSIKSSYSALPSAI
jgi:hypothetical protein